VLNGKATSLPKPTYPAAARAVRASGSVSVQVLIAEDGTLYSARAISGHPLLRSASETAACGSRFMPTLLEGTPVKVSGVITYNYVP
jgi:protein TonB